MSTEGTEYQENPGEYVEWAAEVQGRIKALESAQAEDRRMLATWILNGRDDDSISQYDCIKWAEGVLKEGA